MKLFENNHELTEAKKAIALFEDGIEQAKLSIQAFPSLALLIFPLWCIGILPIAFLKWRVRVEEKHVP